MPTYCCDTCISDILSCLVAEDEVTLNISGLTNGETYLAILSDSQGNSYAAEFDYDGTPPVITIGPDAGMWPATIFNPHIGPLTLEIQTLAGDCVPFNILVQTKCVEINLVTYFTEENKIDSIGIALP